MNILQINENILPQLYEKYNSKGFNTNFLPFNDFTIEIIKPVGPEQRTRYKINDKIINIIDGNFNIRVILNNSNLCAENTALYKLADLLGGTTHKENGVIINFDNFIDNIELYDNNINITRNISAENIKILKNEVVAHINLLNNIINYILDDKQIKHITSSRTPQTRSAGNKKNKKKIKKVKYITNTKYIINNITSNSEKRAYNKICDAWDVRGHWRTYKKSGRRVWVAGYKKGNKEKNTLNHYKIK